MPRYIMCPYFVDENKKSISCEDVCRSYRSHKEKWAWIDMYCDSWDWMKCPYAADLSEAYRKYEKGDKKALDEQKMKSLDKENKYLRTLLGKAEKRVERQQKKIDELRAVNQSFTRVNDNLEKQKKDLYRKWRKAQDELEKDKSEINQQLAKMGIIYEQRMAFLIENYAPDKILVEADVETWAGDRLFAIVHEADAEHGRYWKVVYAENEQQTDNVQDAEQV